MVDCLSVITKVIIRGIWSGLMLLDTSCIQKGLETEMSIFLKKSSFPRDFVISPVSKHFPYARDFVVSPVSSHFWKRLKGWKAGGLQGWKVGWMEGWKAGRLDGWKVRRLEGSQIFVIYPVSRHF